jgi:hypothetical protein
MFLDQSQGAEKEMSEDEDSGNEIEQESGPETAVYIGDNAEHDEDDTDCQPVFNK